MNSVTCWSFSLMHELDCFIRSHVESVLNGNSCSSLPRLCMRMRMRACESQGLDFSKQDCCQQIINQEFRMKNQTTQRRKKSNYQQRIKIPCVMCCSRSLPYTRGDLSSSKTLKGRSLIIRRGQRRSNRECWRLSESSFAWILFSNSKKKLSSVQKNKYKERMVGTKHTNSDRRTSYLYAQTCTTYKTQHWHSVHNKGSEFMRSCLKTNCKN